mgnify:CR=1 FL=1
MLGFKLLHVGVNNASEEAAASDSAKFATLLGQDVKVGNSSMFVGSLIEMMKNPGRGTCGHIAIQTNYLARAMYHLEKRGFVFDESSFKYDAKSRFDFGAYYTPKVLADFVVKLVNYVVAENFPGKSIYDDGNTIVDPCCGTGSFMEALISHDPGNGSYTFVESKFFPLRICLRIIEWLYWRNKMVRKTTRLKFFLPTR